MKVNRARFDGSTKRREPRRESADRVAGSGPVEGLVLELTDLWGEFE